MALRLRRGTDAERLTITPLEGELIYTTDTEKLYIGDGSTAGGNPVDTDSITDELADLTDVDLTGLADGDTIVYNQSNARFEPGTLSTAIGDLTDVDTTGVATGNILKWNGVAFVPATEGGITVGATYSINIDGDLTGSVFADDSTKVIDGLDGSVSSTLINAQVINSAFDNRLVITKPFGDRITEVRIESFQTRNRLNINTVDPTGDLSSYTGYYGTLNFGFEDATTDRADATIRGAASDMRMAHDTVTEFISDESKYFTLKEGKFGFGTYTPEVKLDVRGPIRPAVYADTTARDADIPSPTAGMMIFVTDGDGAGNPQFQGYDGSSWVALN
jgi:hypothetical protein